MAKPGVLGEYMQQFGRRSQGRVNPRPKDSASQPFGKQPDRHGSFHLIFSNLKAWLLGTHHGVSAQHLPAYLNEFVFRFNRRFYPMSAFASALGIGTQVAGPTYDALYGGRWVHPAAPAKL